jgi:hypothetical protein
VDAEGCFNAYVSKNNKSVVLRFIVDQKEGFPSDSNNPTALRDCYLMF